MSMQTTPAIGSQRQPQPQTTPDDAALKARHRAMWALGDYPRVADEIVGPLGATLVDALGITASDEVLDVAAGTGNAAIPAARTGASVTACDLTPELLEAGRRQAAAAGVELRWEQADAERLPYADASYDAVISCVGVMFAPHHQDSADELLRVCRPAGRVGLLSWTPDGFVGRMLKTLSPFAPPPPPGASPAPLWGDPEHVLTLLGTRVADVRAERHTRSVDQFTDAAEWRDYFKTNYGPMVAVYRHLGDDPERVSALDAALVDLADAHDRGDSTTGLVMEWGYLLLTARRT
jgi:ubiquinone/menaquinone biosynthesis C-methylase UbiE